MTASPPDNEAIFHAARDIPDPDRRREYVREACGGDEARIAHIEALLAAADGPDSLLDRPAAATPMATIDQPATESPGTVDRPVQAHRADRRGRHGQRLDGPADRAGQAPGRRQADQGRHGLPPGHRPLRGRAAGAGPDGPPEHRPRAGRRHHQRWPAVLRHGSRQGCAHHPLLRRAPPHAAAAAGTVHPGLPGGPARASEGHHPPRLEALQRAGRPL